jgi:hypothetical protein
MIGIDFPILWTMVEHSVKKEKVGIDDDGDVRE